MKKFAQIAGLITGIIALMIGIVASLGFFTRSPYWGFLLIIFLIICIIGLSTFFKKTMSDD